MRRRLDMGVLNSQKRHCPRCCHMLARPGAWGLDAPRFTGRWRRHDRSIFDSFILHHIFILYNQLVPRTQDGSKLSQKIAAYVNILASASALIPKYTSIVTSHGIAGMLQPCGQNGENVVRLIRVGSSLQYHRMRVSMSQTRGSWSTRPSVRFIHNTPPWRPASVLDE